MPGPFLLVVLGPLNVSVRITREGPITHTGECARVFFVRVAGQPSDVTQAMSLLKFWLACWFLWIGNSCAERSTQQQTRVPYDTSQVGTTGMHLYINGDYYHGGHYKGKPDGWGMMISFQGIFKVADQNADQKDRSNKHHKIA